MIRPARAGEAAALHGLAAETFPLACPPGSTAADQRAFIDANLAEASFAGYLADPDRAILVAEEQGRLLGYTMLVRGEPADADVRAVVPDRPAVELSKCYALPEAHGGRVGGELIAASIRIAREWGGAVLWLGVNQENARAQRFYAKHGFERVGVKRFRVGDRLEHDFVCARSL